MNVRLPFSLEADCKCGASNEFQAVTCCDECSEILWYDCPRCQYRLYPEEVLTGKKGR